MRTLNLPNILSPNFYFLKIYSIPMQMQWKDCWKRKEERYSSY